MTHTRSDDGAAFLPDPEGGPIKTRDGVSDELLEDFMRTATTGEDYSQDLRNEEVPEDHGGPFITTRASEELVDDLDASNPLDAEPAAQPSPMRER